MTSIEQLQISGIRSFDQNRQSIVFHKPLTVILGKNGAGKTTIIEALLNACTGEMPPGMGTEKCSFIYDPKVMGEAEVKAQIRLVFTGRGGTSMQVIRSFQATQTRTKTTFTTLDSTIAYRDEQSGKVISSTHRNSDADRIVPELLGVSPAVLEHVIFCHQEDCNWPLGAPKDLKKYFDDIFAATRYVAALDKLRERGKKYRDELKDHEQQLILLREHQDLARQLKANVAAKQEDVRLITMRKKEIEPRLQQLRQAASALDAVQQNAEDLWKSSMILQGRISEKMLVIERAHLPAVKQTLGELKDMQREFDASMKRLQKETDVKEGRCSAAEVARRQREVEAGECRSSLQVLLSQEQVHKKLVSELISVAKSISSEFVLGEDAVDERALQSVVSAVKAAKESARQQLGDKERQVEATRAELADKRDQILRAMDADSKERELKEAQLRTLQQRVTDKKKDLVDLGQSVSPQQVDAAKKQIETLRRRLAAAEALRKEGAQHKQVECIIKSIEEKNRLVSQLRMQIMEAKRDGGRIGQVPFLEKQIADKQEAVRREIEDVVNPAIDAQGGKKPKSSAVRDVSLAAEQLLTQRRESAVQSGEQLRSVDREVAALSEKLADAQRHLSNIEIELQRRQSVCASVLGSAPEAIENFDAALRSADEAFIKTCRHTSSIESMSKCYDTFVQSAKSERMCVVCKRGLPDEALVDFVKLNEDRRKATPEQLERASKDSTKAKEHLERLRKIEPSVSDVRRLSAEVSDTKKHVADLRRDVDAKRELMAALSARNSDLSAKAEQAADIVSRMQKVNVLAAEISTLSAELTELHKLAQAKSAQTNRRPLEELERECDAGMAELQNLNEQLQELQRRGDGQHAPEGVIQSELLEWNSKLLQLEDSRQRQVAASGNIAELEAEAAEHRQRLQIIATRRIDLQQQLDRVRQTMDKESTASTAALASLKSKVTEAEDHERLLDQRAAQVLQYLKTRAVDKIASLREALRVAEAGAKQEDEEILKLRREIVEAKKILDDQDRNFREIGKHIEALTRKQELDEDRAKLADVEKTLFQLKSEKVKDVEALLGPQSGSEPLSKTRDAIRQKLSELEQKKAQFEGSAEATEHAAGEIKAELAKERFDNIDKRYNSTFIKVQTVGMAVQDIDKYYRALEKAVQSYHQEKIAQINQIVNELWRATYRGSDIDTIELRSEVETGSTSSRRSYNYRIVIKRGNSELDMRGRCSAGQKVLASVIIRMALSEAFCCDCGILALDEPTTNLDEDNARALAEALRELINTRRAVKHFQLIVITHDEQFVRALGAQSTDTFYFVHKDRQGAFSVIEERTFEQLFA